MEHSITRLERVMFYIYEMVSLSHCEYHQCYNICLICNIKLEGGSPNRFSSQPLSQCVTPKLCRWPVCDVMIVSLKLEADFSMHQTDVTNISVAITKPPVFINIWFTPHCVASCLPFLQKVEVWDNTRTSIYTYPLKL